MEKMVTVDIGLPKDFYLNLEKSYRNLKQRLKEMIAIESFRSGELSLGKASEVAEMNKLSFIELLNRNRVSIFGSDKEEFKRQFKVSHRIAKRLQDDSSS